MRNTFSFLRVTFVFHLCYFANMQQVFSQLLVHANVNEKTNAMWDNYWSAVGEGRVMFTISPILYVLAQHLEVFNTSSFPCPKIL